MGEWGIWRVRGEWRMEVVLLNRGYPVTVDGLRLWRFILREEVYNFPSFLAK